MKQGCPFGIWDFEFGPCLSFGACYLDLCGLAACSIRWGRRLPPRTGRARFALFAIFLLSPARTSSYNVPVEKRPKPGRAKPRPIREAAPGPLNSGTS